MHECACFRCSLRVCELLRLRLLSDGCLLHLLGRLLNLHNLVAVLLLLRRQLLLARVDAIAAEGERRGKTKGTGQRRRVSDGAGRRDRRRRAAAAVAEAPTPTIKQQTRASSIMRDRTRLIERRSDQRCPAARFRDLNVSSRRLAAAADRRSRASCCFCVSFFFCRDCFTFLPGRT